MERGGTELSLRDVEMGSHHEGRVDKNLTDVHVVISTEMWHVSHTRRW